jgi:hypothetical protein
VDYPGIWDRVRAFYEDTRRPLEVGTAAADVILVPILTFNLLGWVTLHGTAEVGIVAVVAAIDVSSTALLLVSGLAPTPRVACPNCYGPMLAEVSKWKCGNCGARVTKPRAKARPAEEAVGEGSK